MRLTAKKKYIHGTTHIVVQTYTISIKSHTEQRDHWGDLGVDGWIILGWISRRWDVGIWTGLGWPRIGTVGGRL